MSGVLIYTKKEAARNAFAVEKYKSFLDITLKNEDYDGEADFVINRTNDCEIAKRFEKRKIRVFNPSELSSLANDKQRCYEFMQKNGVPIMPIDYFGLPAVKKPVDGHGGQGVVMINRQELHEVGFVYQKPCDTLGRDLRIWAIGGKIRSAVLRESKTDFRSNYCLGGSARVYALSKCERELVERVLSLVKSDFIGVDFLFDEGRLVFNELEDTVGARMLYTLTDIDIIKDYCDYIKTQLKRI